MKLHITLRNGGKKTNERKSTDLQTQNETCSEAGMLITQVCFISGSRALEEKYFFFLEQVRITKKNKI